MAWVVSFHGSQRDIFFLLFPPCSSISKDAHEILTKTQFKCRRPSPCVSVFIKKPLLLENSSTTQVRQIQKKRCFPFVLPQRPTCPPCHPCPEARSESSELQPVREQGAGPGWWGAAQGPTEGKGGEPPHTGLSLL